MVVITGATGHIGNNLARLFVEHGEPVRLLLRRDGAALSDLAVEKVYGDVFDADFLAAHVRDGDVLVHLAALIDLSNRHGGDTVRINYDGTRTIADFCVARGVRLVFVSSVDAIAKPEPPRPIREPDRFDPDSFHNAYARSKALATAYVHRLLSTGALQGCILYPSAVIGIHDYKPSAAGREIARTFAMRFAFCIRGGYNFIDVRDVAAAIRRAAVERYSGSCILAAHNVTVRQLYEALFAAEGRKVPVLRVPVALARLGGLFMKGFSNVMIDALEENYDYDNARMRRDLVPDPIPFSVTVRDTVAWFRTHPLPR
ncbi:MAG: NAD-dependent epimerase/dehydratase family protein [Candidatus Izemoplasmatales bacterium]